MADVINVKGFRGLVYYCSESQWNQHIVNEITGHPVMKENIDSIVETIKNPDYVYESNDSNPPFDYRQVFSKDTANATYHSRTPYTRVVVSAVGGSCEIITAFPAKTPTGAMKGELIHGKAHDN